MPFSRLSDGSLRITPQRTRWRALFAMLILAPAIMTGLFLAWFAIYLPVWTLPLKSVPVLALAMLLSPQTWVAVMSVANFGLFWDGTALLSREGRYLVYKRLTFGRGFSHRTDIQRLHALSVSVQRYPADAERLLWRPSFKPRVVVQDGSSRILALGETLTLSEAASLAAAVGELIGAPVQTFGHVEQADQADGKKGVR